MILTLPSALNIIDLARNLISMSKINVGVYVSFSKNGLKMVSGAMVLARGLHTRSPLRLDAGAVIGDCNNVVFPKANGEHEKANMLVVEKTMLCNPVESKTLGLHNFVDSDCGGDLDCHGSTSAYVLILFGGGVSWIRKRQLLLRYPSQRLSTWQQFMQARKQFGFKGFGECGGTTLCRVAYWKIGAQESYRVVHSSHDNAMYAFYKAVPYTCFTVIALRASLDAMESQTQDKAALDDFSKIVINAESNEMMNNFPNGALSQAPRIYSPSSNARRVLSGRSLTMIRSMVNDNTDLEDGAVEKDNEKTPREHSFTKLRNQALLSGIAYCLSSCGMILVNKAVLSSYKFDAGISLMFYQNLVGVIIVIALSFFGIITTEPLTWKLIKVWYPVNVIFVGMLITSIFSLKYINVAMVTILKNVTNIITAVGEVYLFEKKHNNKVWTALFLMIISAICGGITDLSFHAVGYAWQILNCLLTASYSLTLRRLMDVAKKVTKSGNLNEFSMVLLNNSLSLPLGLMLMLVFNEWQYLYDAPLVRQPMFIFVATFSGFLGLAISFTSMWFLHQTGPTTY
ncbi:hypothetical protein KI387_019045, partial [Taxus chinensis]